MIMYNDVKLALGEPVYSSVVNCPEKINTLPKMFEYLRKEYDIRNPFVHWSREISKTCSEGRPNQLRISMAVSQRGGGGGSTLDQMYRAWYIDRLREPYQSKSDDMYLPEKSPLAKCMKAARTLDKRFAKKTSFSLAVNAVYSAVKSAIRELMPSSLRATLRRFHKALSKRSKKVCSALASACILPSLQMRLLNGRTFER